MRSETKEIIARLRAMNTWRRRKLSVNEVVTLIPEPCPVSPEQFGRDIDAICDIVERRAANDAKHTKAWLARNPERVVVYRHRQKCKRCGVAPDGEGKK